MNAFVIDAFEFCRLKESRSGEITIADLLRLAEESIDKTGVVQWSLRGGSDKRGHLQLVLSISGALRLMCQRCLSPFLFNIASESVLVLAPDEGSADEIDALLADESVEVVVGSRDFDIVRLVEDEALLNLPSSPRHEICPHEPTKGNAEEVERISPFSVLKKLKQ